MVNKMNIHRIDVHREMEMSGGDQCHGNSNRKNRLAGHAGLCGPAAWQL